MVRVRVRESEPVAFRPQDPTLRAPRRPAVPAVRRVVTPTPPPTHRSDPDELLALTRTLTLTPRNPYLSTHPDPNRIPTES